MLRQAARVVPPLSASRHKGQAGRVLVVGGSAEYTASRALRGGADMVHVVCTELAASPIKSLSPELIVIPALASSSSSSLTAELGLLDRVQVVTIGSGLGRNEYTLKHATAFINAAKEKGLPLVLDGDALWHVSRNLELVHGYDKVLLTPNQNEFKNLAKAAGLKEDADVKELAAKLGVTVLQKGVHDKVASPTGVFAEVEQDGSPRRCAGQGDVLAGLCATFMAWSYACKEDDLPPRPLLAGYAACVVSRICAERAFAKCKRGMITSDLIAELPSVFESLFPAASASL